MRVAAIFSVFIAIAAIFLSQWIDDPSTDAVYGATFWPVFLAASLLVLNIPSLLLSGHKQLDTAQEQDSTSGWRGLAELDWGIFLAPSLLVVLYPLAVEYIGFPVASVLFYFLLVTVLRQQGFMLKLSVATIFPLLLAFFFTRIAYMPLPKGIGPFEDFTILLYRLIGAY